MLNKILCVKAPNIYEHNFILESVTQFNIYCLSYPYIKVMSIYVSVCLPNDLANH